MEGATRSGLMVADEIIARADGPDGLKAKTKRAEQTGAAATVA
jgi:zeta-carotene desaturase